MMAGSVVLAASTGISLDWQVVRGQDGASAILVLTDSARDTVTFLSLDTNERESVLVGAAPWGIARQDDRAFVATAEGVAVLDLPARERTALYDLASS